MPANISKKKKWIIFIPEYSPPIRWTSGRNEAKDQASLRSQAQLRQIGIMMKKDPLVPIGWGELIDKIIILEIKEQRAEDHQAKNNVKKELALLKSIAGDRSITDQYLSSLCFKLKIVNQKIWDAEDALRQKEKSGHFDDEFIALARSVYNNKDMRASLKRDINIHLNSFVIEEKIYAVTLDQEG